MTDIGFDGDFGAPERGAVVQRLVNLSGAAVSLALIGGLGVWGYEFLVRDVTGVPVIQAMEGAFRTAPEKPGGMTAPHQGLSVNEIAAVGSAGGPADTVRLAPAPVTLAEEDGPALELSPPLEPRQLTALDDTDATGTTQIVAEAVEIDEGPSEIGIAIDAAPGDALAIDRAVAEALGGMIEPEPAMATMADAAALVSASSISPRPAPRPAVFRPTEPIAVAPARAAPVALEVSAGALQPGTRLVQIGAYANADLARSDWNRLGASFAGAFDGKRRVIQTAQADGRTFHRLRVEGFEDDVAVARFCTALAAGGAECIPVAAR